MRSRSVLLAALTAAAASATVLAGLHTASAQSASPVCDVSFTVNQWNSGFTADVKVTNTGAAVTTWTLGWTFAGDQRITSAWNAKVSQSGAAVTAGDAGWNGSLATGASASFGFQATWSGTNTKPVGFTFNGAPCGGAPPSSSPSPSASAEPSAEPSASTPPPGGSCPVWAICDGFEDQASSTPGGRWAVTYPDCQGAGTATVDTSGGRGGSTALKVSGAAGYCNHVFVRSTGILGLTGDQTYVRYYVKHTTALPSAHITTVALRDANDGGRDLRFGGQNGALQWNRGSDDATLPEQSPTGVALSSPLPTGSWNCVEFKVDSTDGTMETWLNGTSVPGLLQDGVATHDIDGQWLNRTYRPALTDLKLGWESYGEGADTLWYDDVAAGNFRIGC